MKCLVVCESMYGNTRQIAEAVAAGMVGGGFDASVCDVGDAPARIPADVDLLVVGAPTHAHGLSRAGTRNNAAAHGADGHSSTGLREWLTRLDGQPGRRYAAFDTRLHKPRWLTGSAARGAARRLRRKGLTPAGPPASFFVSAAAGPLEDGELQRARQWAASIGNAVAASTTKRGS